MQRTFKAVPLDPAWVHPGTKLDLKAIFRRPRRRVGDDGALVHERSREGLLLYDLTGPLPLRRFSDWTAKGFEYVTLADAVSLKEAAPYLRARGLDPNEFVLQRNTITGASPWSEPLYSQAQAAIDSQRAEELRALVAQLGSRAVQTMIRATTDAGFELPEELRNVPAAAAAENGARV